MHFYGVFFQEKHVLHQYSVNGKFLCSRKVAAPVSHMTIAGDHLAMCDNDGQLTIFQLFGYVHKNTFRMVFKSATQTPSYTNICTPTNTHIRPHLHTHCFSLKLCKI
jgi:hypothetical protein